MKGNETVLVVEDDLDDLFLTTRVLRKAGVTAIAHAADGKAAIAYLTGQDAYADRKIFPLPDVIFLDLKMPQMDGHQVLEWLRRQPNFQALPVYVLTSSDEPRDRKRAVESGASGYFVKPLSPADVLRVKV